MKRGELYLVSLASKNDVKKQRVYVVVSRQAVIDSAYSTVICAPVYTSFEGLATQVEIGIEVGLKHESAIRCDELISIRKAQLTEYIGVLPKKKIDELNDALLIAVGIEG
ncbi:MAG: type II toxin-antitoxin system PemK/MazF family toxin [Fibromonadales bacterium]|nr:type II toxin-antitoxin system PemK/MazF family toxin [Fibromonadales bacterium]